MAEAALELFSQKVVKDAIAEIASTDDNITIVVGAGASIPSGLPPWRDLCEGVVSGALLTRYGKDWSDTMRAEAPMTARSIVDTYGAPAAVTLAECLTSRESVEQSVYDKLYRNAGNPWSIPILVAAIARRWRGQCHVVTTNYDSLLEEAVGVLADRRQQAFTSRPITEGSELTNVSTSPDEIPIIYLHGRIPRRGSRSDNLVVGENDYFLRTRSGSWQEEYFSERLSTSTCLFVGLSSTDPNLLRYLYTYSDRPGTTPARAHYAVFAPLTEPEVPSDLRGDNADKDTARRAIREAFVERARQFGVTSIQANLHSQVPQFLAEVLAARRERIAGREAKCLYGRRLKTWQQEMHALLGDAGRFDVVQRTMANKLNETIRAISSEAQIDTDPEPERLLLEIWLRNVQTKSLERWAISDRLYRSRSSVWSRTIKYSSNYVAVHSFCYGSVQLDRERGRHDDEKVWRYIRAQPIFLWEKPWEYLQVGCITLSSTREYERSRLWNRLETVQRELDVLGVALADPRSLRGLIGAS